MEYNQGFSWHGCVDEGIATAVWPHSALQVSPVPYRVHGLVPGRALIVSLSVFSESFAKPRPPQLLNLLNYDFRISGQKQVLLLDVD